MLIKLAESLFIILALILSTFWLKNRGILREQDSPTLTRIVTDLMLPALIFSNISRHALELDKFVPALIMFLVTLIIMLLAWQVGKRFGLEPHQLGAFIMVSGISSASSMGYAMVSQVYPGNEEALYDAILIGELGATVPIFLIGIPIAIHFGVGEDKHFRGWDYLKPFLRSPVIIALALGTAASLIGVPDNAVTQTLYRFLDILGGAMVVIVAFSVGLLLRRIHLRNVWGIVGFVVALKLVLEPLLVIEASSMMHIDQLDRNVLLIEAAMPSGAIAALLASRYGCDGSFASAIVVATYLVSLASVPLMATLLV